MNTSTQHRHDIMTLLRRLASDGELDDSDIITVQSVLPIDEMALVDACAIQVQRDLREEAALIASWDAKQLP